MNNFFNNLHVCIDENNFTTMSSLSKLLYSLAFLSLIIGVSALMINSKLGLGEHTFAPQNTDQLSNYGDDYQIETVSELK